MDEKQRRLQRAIAEHQRGNHQEAAGISTRLTREYPEYAEAHLLLGLIRERQGLLDEAEASYRRAMTLAPERTGWAADLARTLQRKRRYREAIRLYRDAVAARPGDGALDMAIGECCLHIGDLAEAELHLNRAIEKNPGLDMAEKFQGDVFRLQAKHRKAVDHYQRALAINPDNLPALNALGAAWARLRDYDAALGCYKKLLEKLPESAVVFNNMAIPFAETCEFDRREEFAGKFQEAVSRHIGGPDTEPLDPFSLNFFEIPISFRRRVAAHRSRQIETKVAEARQRLTQRLNRTRSDRIRVGYLSVDFRFHPIGILTRELYRCHDRSRFEVFGYSLAGVSDEYTAVIRRGCDRFRSFYGLPAEHAARTIHQDGIDVLIDMCGYTNMAYTEIAALRPAKAQISFLGYLDTMAADFIQYLIADEIVIPRSETDAYREEVLYLPYCFMPAGALPDPRGKIRRRDLGIPEKAFVFCCHNRLSKIDPGVFSAWMTILRQVPDSVLWLLDNGCATAIRNLREQAKRAGVNPGRLVFSKNVDFDRYLARYRLADLFLDTFVYNAGATAIFALWMGLPVLTRRGDNFLSRMCASINTAVGLPELICQDSEEYVQKGVHLATHPAELEGIREKLEANRPTAPLFDIERYVRGLERLFCRIVQ